VIDWLRSRRVQAGKLKEVVFVLTVLCLIVLVCLTVVLFSEILKILSGSKPKKKYPTLEDIRRKYPKRKSQEQIRAENLNERRAAYDRDLANRIRAKGITQSIIQKDKDSDKYRKLLRMLGGDRETADRLIGYFGIDQAILDLERDRR
jgi:hypothetical protein